MSQTAERHRNLRDWAIKVYGGKCACCSTIENLTVDHIDGSAGGIYRSARSPGGTTIYTWLLHRGYPKGFQILCRSCNASKRKGSVCRLHNRVLDGSNAPSIQRLLI